MVGAVIGGGVAKAAAKLVGPAIMVAIAAAVGFGAGTLWEHRGHQGFPLGIFGDSLKVQRDKWQEAYNKENVARRAWQTAAGNWRLAEGRCEGARSAANDQETEAVTTGSTQRSAGERSAFDNGYAAGRVAGRRTCGATNAPSSPDPIGDLASGGVRQPPVRTPAAGGWGSGAYRAPGSVPADH